MIIRFFDIIFSLFALLFLMPILLPVLILLCFTGERKIFYLQKRVGLGEKKFSLIKFATMLENSPNLGTGNITVMDDPRVLPFGKFLRKSKINELPQLYNILIGNMSVVGPRPLTEDIFNLYDSDIKVLVTSKRPGLTGMGSIIFRDEETILDQKIDQTRFYADFISAYKGELERWYMENNSLYLYFKIIFVTALVTLNPKKKIGSYFFKDLPAPPQELESMLN